MTFLKLRAQPNLTASLHTHAFNDIINDKNLGDVGMLQECKEKVPFSGLAPVLDKRIWIPWGENLGWHRFNLLCGSLRVVTQRN